MKRRSRIIRRLLVGMAALLVCGIALVVLGRSSEVQGTTPLFFAQSAEQALQLIAGGANVDARSDFGCTPLHFAAGRGQADVVKVLLDHGADPTARSVDGASPLHWATQQHWDPDEGRHALRGPFDRKGKLESARLLIGHGAIVDARDTGGRTPLFAASEDDPALTQLLLDAGANPNATDVDGFTSLHHTRDANVAMQLLHHGARINARDKWEHRTPLCFANDEVATVLTKAGGTK